jgi:peroxiredoxin
MHRKLTVLFLLIASAVFALDAGQKAADFSLKDGNGKQVSLTDYKGKNVLVIFVSVRCPYSNAFNKVMAELGQKYSAKGINIIGINANSTETAEDVAAHAKKNFPFVVLKDVDNKIADLYGASVTPEAFLIDETGTIRYHGALGNSNNPTTDESRANSKDVSAAIDALLSGKEIAKNKTKAFGCTIKRV